MLPYCWLNILVEFVYFLLLNNFVGTAEWYTYNLSDRIIKSSSHYKNSGIQEYAVMTYEELVQEVPSDSK